MSSNYRRNKAAIDKFRKELKAMLDDISDIDKKVLNKAVNTGAAYARRNTPVISGWLRRNWSVLPTKKTSDGIEKELINNADYASFYNYGHRIVNRNGETIGWVRGRFLLEKAMHRVDKALVREFKKRSGEGEQRT